MIQIVYSPKWFYGQDIGIEAIGMIILLVLAILNLQYYRLNKNKKNHLWLAISFILLALSFLSKIITNFTIHSKVLLTKTVGNSTFVYQMMNQSDTLFDYGFLFYMIFGLIGLYILYEIYQKDHPPARIGLTFLLMAVAIYFSAFPYIVFNMIAAGLLFLITGHYYNIYKNNNHGATKVLAISFGILTLSHLMLLFANVQSLLYVIAEVIRLLGYLLLSITIAMVLKDGKKINNGKKKIKN